MSQLITGLEATLGMTVGADDTAVAVGSGDVAVLATPRLLALCEGASVEAVREALPAHLTSVGATVEIRHLAPSRVGASVTAHARLIEVDGRHLDFEVEVEDGGNLVADGRIRRVVVERSSFSG